MIGTVAGARAQGAAGDDPTVTALLVAAQDRVERYCQDRFEPDSSARLLRVVDGIAIAPVTLRGVTSVATYGSSPVTIPATGYRLVPRTGAVSGGVDYIGVEVASSGGDGLIAGAEPWNGGWANLWGSASTEFVEVAGSWGWSAAPAEVVLAVEMLAAVIGPTTFEPSADAEGNPVGWPQPDTTPAQFATPTPERLHPAGRTERTTGSAEVDRMLEPYRRTVLNLG